VLVVSDHGARKMEGGICFNEWLMREGYLTLVDPPTKPTPTPAPRSTGHARRRGAMAATTVASS